MMNRYQHPIIFYTFATLIPWISWFSAAYLSRQPGQEASITLLCFLGLIAPNVIAAVLIFPDSHLRQDVMQRLFNLKNIKVLYWILAFFLMLASILLAQAVSLIFGYSADQFHLADAFSFSSGLMPVWFLLLAAPFLEELAWHSYGTDCLRSRFSLLTTSMIFALYWGFWHFPLSFIRDYYHSNLAETNIIYSLNFFVSLFPFVLIMNWLYYKTGRNILIAIIFHITAGYFNEIFQTHPMSKVIQTILLSFLAIALIIKDKKDFTQK